MTIYVHGIESHEYKFEKHKDILVNAIDDLHVSKLLMSSRKNT